MSGKIDDQIRTFRGREHQVPQLERRRQEAGVGADLIQSLTVGERQMEEPAVRAVEQSEAVFAWFDFQVGEDLAVNQDRVAEKLGDPRRRIRRHRIIELALAIEHPVVDDEWNFVFGKPRRKATVIRRAGLCRGESTLSYYPNHQDPAMLCYHDHAVGINRLNIFARLVGAFIIRDEIKAGLNLPKALRLGLLVNSVPVSPLTVGVLGFGVNPGSPLGFVAFGYVPK